MSMWWQNHSVSAALCMAAFVAASARALHDRAAALTSPSSRRRAQEQVVRLITVVAGH